MNILRHMIDTVKGHAYAEETLRGYRDSIPDWISRGRSLHRFLKNGRKQYPELSYEECIVFLIADMEVVISTNGWKECFTDDTRISRTKDLIDALYTIGETHTISMINDFLKELENHGFTFESASVARYINDYPVVDSFWNRRFMLKSSFRWSRLKVYFNRKDSLPLEETVVLH